MKTCLAVGLCVLAGLAGCSRPRPNSGTPRDISTVPAVDYLAKAFERYPLVAFSEPRHGAAGTTAFLRSLVRHPRFADTVNDVVVEFGNARYQDLADRYVAGEHVARDQLTQIWENTTVVTGVWTAPMYEGFLNEIRALNATRPPNRHVRVLLGDPPIDWRAVRGPADEDMNDWRDAHFAWVVDEQVMKKGRRALLWIGGAHVSRHVLFPESLIHLLDRRFPGNTLVALSIDRRDVEDRISTRLGQWPVVMAAPLRGTWLGRQESRAVGWQLSAGTVEQNADVAIFWDPAGGPDEAPRIEPGSAAAAELQRRQRLADATTAFRGGRIRFSADRAQLTPDSAPALEAVLAEMRRDVELKLLVKAFADAREANGAQLARERAAHVVQWLVERGIARERLEPRGCGASRALWFGRTEQERAANRKAELVRLSDRAGCEPPASFDFRSPSGALSQVPDASGVAWLIFVDDLHINFRNTGYLRALLKSIASELIRPGDLVAARSIGPSRLAIDLTSDRSLLEAAIARTSGSALNAADILATPARDSTAVAEEIAYRLKITLAAASAMIAEGARAGPRPKALLYISNGYSGDTEPLSQLARAARQAGVMIFTLDPRGVPGSPLAGERSSATQSSLRALGEPTRGFALLDPNDYEDGMARIRRAVLALRR